MLHDLNQSPQKETRRILRKNQTPQETILWSKLRNNQTGFKWRRQVSIGLFIADFYCADKLLVVEVDGSQHMDNTKYDLDRARYFSTLGIKTIRFWNNEVNTNINGVMIKIQEKLK